MDLDFIMHSLLSFVGKRDVLTCSQLPKKQLVPFCAVSVSWSFHHKGMLGFYPCDTSVLQCHNMPGAPSI